MITEAEKLIDILNSVKIHCDDSPTPGTGFIRNARAFYHSYFRQSEHQGQEFHTVRVYLLRTHANNVSICQQ